MWRDRLPTARATGGGWAAALDGANEDACAWVATMVVGLGSSDAPRASTPTDALIASSAALRLPILPR